MKVLGRLHEVLIRRIDKDNPESDYYELYPTNIADNIYMNDDEDESLSEFLSNMDFKYNIFLDNLKFPVSGVTVFDGKNFGPVKLGIVKLTSKDFGLDRVDNTSDAEKPVNENHRIYIEGYLNTITDQISNILSNIDNWNSHMLDYNNPHKVTWQQVTGGSPINPNELVDKKFVNDSINDHNLSSDMTTLHPDITKQISKLQSKVNELSRIIETIESNMDNTISNITNDQIYDHNKSPSAHPNLISRLNQLSLDITAAIEQYSGMNGMEFVSNRIDELDLQKMNDRWDETYDGKYPSVNAIKKLIVDMELNMYLNVDYFENTTIDEINRIAKEKLSGIIFAEKIDGVAGTHIFVHQKGIVTAKYSLPENAPLVSISQQETAPTKPDVEKKYGRNNAIIFANHSTSSSNHQSIVLWYNYTYYEYIIDTLKISEDEAIYGAEYANTNIDYDFTKFTTGHGILFVSKLNDTDQPGVVLYNKGGNPELQEINYGSSPVDPPQQMIREYPSSPTNDEIKSILPTGTGLIYVKNMQDNGMMTVPGLEYWMNFKRKFSRPLIRTIVEKHTFTWIGNGSETVRFTNQYSEPPMIICILEGFDLRNSNSTLLTITADATKKTISDAIIEYNITNNVSAKYSVFVVGVPYGLIN